jgi:hypothetical protein
VSHYEVTCINKRGDHYSPHERIQAIGAVGWKHLEDDAIGRLERRTDDYSVSRVGRTVRVVVATHLGRKYLRPRQTESPPTTCSRSPNADRPSVRESALEPGTATPRLTQRPC